MAHQMPYSSMTDRISQYVRRNACIRGFRISTPIFVTYCHGSDVRANGHCSGHERTREFKMADSTVANTSKEQKVVNLSQLGVPQLEQIKTQLEEVRGAHILTCINRVSTVHLAYTGIQYVL